MSELIYPVNPAQVREEILAVTEGYGFRANGGINYSKDKPAGFAVMTTLVDIDTLQRTSDGFTATDETEMMVFERLGDEPHSGFITGYLDKPVPSADSLFPDDCIAESMVVELGEEAGVEREAVAQMEYVPGARYSYPEKGGRTMHIFTGSWACRRDVRIDTDRVEAPGEPRELGAAVWTPLGKLARDAARHPRLYTPEFANTTLVAVRRGFVPAVKV